MDLVLGELNTLERQSTELFVSTASQILKKFDCQAEIRRFLPVDLPVLYSVSEETQFLRQMQSARENASNLFSDALSSLINGVEEKPLATVYFNLNNPLIQHLVLQVTDETLLKSLVRVLYVQAFLAGGHPLKGVELKILNEELLNLVEYKL